MEEGSNSTCEMTQHDNHAYSSEMLHATELHDVELPPQVQYIHRPVISQK